MGGTLPLQMSQVTSHHVLHSLSLPAVQSGVTQCSMAKNELSLGCHGSVFAGVLKASVKLKSVSEKLLGQGVLWGVCFFVCSRPSNKLQLLLELDSAAQALLPDKQAGLYLSETKC